jgi:hypothetical protein
VHVYGVAEGSSFADGPRSSGVDEGDWPVRRAGFAHAGGADDRVVADCRLCA